MYHISVCGWWQRLCYSDGDINGANLPTIFEGGFMKGLLRTFLACFLVIPFAASASAQTYTVETVYEAPEEADLGELSLDGEGNIYFVDRKGITVQKLAVDGTVTTVAGGGTVHNLLIPSILQTDSFPATDANLAIITNVEAADDGTLYLQIAKNTWRVDPAGVMHRFAGAKALSTASTFTGAGGPALDAVIPQPGGDGGAAIFGDNVFLKTGITKPQILKIDKDGIITVYAGNAERGTDGDGGAALEAQLNGLGNIEVDSEGNMYLASDEIIRKISTDGIISRIIGTLDFNFSRGGPIYDDVPATELRLKDILYHAVGPDGSVYFAHIASDQVHKYSNGRMSTIAGKSTDGFSGDGGPALEAEFNTISGIAVDAAGNVYVTDKANDRIRKLIPSGTAGGGSGGSGGDGGDGGSGDGDTGSGGDTTTGGDSGDSGDNFTLVPADGDGSWAMDLDSTTGDQEVRIKSVAGGETFTVELIYKETLAKLPGRCVDDQV
jgi:hypothetical protein